VVRASTHPSGVTREMSVSGGQLGSTFPAGTLTVQLRPPLLSRRTAAWGPGARSSACRIAGMPRKIGAYSLGVISLSRGLISPTRRMASAAPTAPNASTLAPTRAACSGAAARTWSPSSNR
jgi:hypothetical protein